MARSPWRKKQARSASPVRGRSRNRAAHQHFTPHIETLEDRWLLSACTVTSLADSGPGTLRDCIDQVNAGNADTINFAATGVIQVHTNLAPIFNPVTIMGPQSTPPLVFIEPDATSTASTGLRISGGNSTVANLGIGGFGGSGMIGLFLDSNGGDTVQNCYLGFGDDAGLAPLPNYNGMLIGAPNNVIGGTLVNQGNVSANNVNFGVEILAGATHNQLIGNYIGTDPNDALNEGNGTGLVVESDSNTIGGTTAAERNIISGNQATGLQLSAASNNLIQGNYIGTRRSGNLPLPNQGFGIDIASQSNTNTIGGNAGTLEANLISGNLQGGVHVSISAGNIIKGDVIGLNPSGSLAIPNSAFGISISGGTSNTIGGASVSDRNIISGNNGDGVQISGMTNLVEQDYIGTDFTGRNAFPNSGSGVVVTNGMSNRIGGQVTDPTQPLNLISGNKQSGIQIKLQAASTMVQGNFIGTDVTGRQPLGNATDPSSGLLLNAGISISGGATQTCVGGTFLGGTVNACLGGAYLNGTRISEYRNVIAANQGPDGLAPGISVTGFDTDPFSTTSNNLIAGNFIGTDWSGTLTSYQPDPMTPPVPLGNGRGVYIWGRANNNVVGDPTPRGGTMSLGTRNIIAGNLYDGVALSDRGTSNNNLYDNYIGTDISGTLLQDMNGVRYGNGAGVEIFDGATANQVGGYIRPDQSRGFVAPDTNMNSRDIFGHGNLIAGNLREGVYIHDSNTSQNLVQGNLIGNYVDAADGIDKPLVSRDATTGQFTGQTIGVALGGASSNNEIGGTVLDTINMQDFVIPAGDTISGNTIYGVAFQDRRTYLNRVEGDMIGPDTSGLKAVVYHDVQTDEVFPVQPYGAAFYGGAGNAVFHQGNTLGGTTSLSRNIITGNVNDGVLIFGTPDPLDDEELPQYNVVLGNYIGTNIAGLDYLKDPYHPLVNIGNGGNGINVYFSAHDNTIGGTDPVLHNLITGNPLDGILIDSEAHNNSIEGNWIGLDARGLLFQAGPGNGGNGIEMNLGHNDMLPPHDNTVGGIVVGSGNVISANTLDGILITAGSTNNVIQGNHIGTDTGGNLRGGRTDLGNGANGIDIVGDGTNQNTIGGLLDGMANHVPGNTIGFNGNDGILIDTGILNPILSNNIAMDNDPNAASGIDPGINLVNSGNDLGNGVMHPDTSWLTQANYDTVSGMLTFSGSVPASFGLMPNTTYILHFFLNSSPSASGLGEGELFVGGIFLVTDANGAAVIDPNDPVNPASFYFPVLDTSYFQWVTMTLTYPNPNMDPNHPWGDTSDFSGNVPLTTTPSAGDQGFGVGTVQAVGVNPVQVGSIAVGVTVVPLTGLTVGTISLGSGAAPAVSSADASAQGASSTAVDQFFARTDRAFDSMAHALGRLHLGHHRGEADFGDLLLGQLTDLSASF